MMMIIMMIMLVHARSMSDDGYDVDDDDDDDGWMGTAIIGDTALYRYECMQLIKKPGGGGETTPKPGKRHHHLRHKTAIALQAQQHCKEHAIKYDSLCRQLTKT
jgi:hypothetical protein